MSNNQFIQLVIDTDAKTADTLSDIFMELGALSATVSDENEGTSLEQAIFNEPQFEVTEFWKHSRLFILFNNNIDINHYITEASNINGKQFDYRLEFIDDQDWVRLTQSQFEPIKINNNLYIVPSWHQSPNKNAKTITLDPGIAFGTGSHPTTFMCLDWISNNISTKTTSTLDYGCGSGILAIASKKFGSNIVFGTDIDEQAIEASRSNALINQADIYFDLPSGLPKTQDFEIVIANILSNPLRILAPTLATLTSNKLLLSGILETQTDELSKIYSKWFQVSVVNSIDGWILLECTK